MTPHSIFHCVALVSALLVRDLTIVNILPVQAAPPHFYRYRFASASPQPKKVIGKDNRQLLATGNTYPWSAIGRIFPGNCTATLIGVEWLLTNAHCAIDYAKTGDAYPELTFYPNIINGKLSDQQDVARVTEAIAGTNFAESIAYRHQYAGWRGISIQDSAQDWAVLKLDKPLGTKYGYWRWRSIPTPELVQAHQNKLSIAGYPDDFSVQGDATTKGNTLAVQEGCSILKEEQNMLYHDCDTAKGSSGSPIFYKSGTEYYMVALNNASSNLANYAVNLRDLPEFVLDPDHQWEMSSP